MDAGIDSARANRRARVRIRVDGIVQGVGFRPFVHSLTGRIMLSGFVRNDSRGVVIEVEGAQDRVYEFIGKLQSEAPPLAAIERIESLAIPLAGDGRFEINESDGAGDRDVLIAPDIATCDDCVREIFTPSDRRFRYPFNNCTNCGPRFTIVIGVRYDRSLTTMARFAMCLECVREYSDPPNRRFHAQPVSCPRCGPVLRLIDSGGNSVAGDPIRAAAERLRSGEIVAVKDSADFILRRTPLMKAQSPRYAGVCIASTSRSRSWCAT